MLKQHAIPFFKPSIGEAEIESVVETLRSGWLTTGPKTRQFEQEFAQEVHAEYAIAVGACTHALTLALEALGVGPGDEVLVPTLTFASTAEVVMHLGATPVLVDVLPGTLNLDPADLERRITGKTKVVVPVHYGGQPVRLGEIHEIAQSHGLAVVEDAAHALPASIDGRPIGALSDATCFSFYANKTITTGEGGMLTTNRQDIAERVRKMSLHGISKDAWKRFSAEGSWYYEITAPGYKFNMTDLAASIGIHQLKKCHAFWERRRAIAERYTQAFASLPEIRLLDVDPHVQHAWHLFVIMLETERLAIDRAEFIRKLNELGVGTSVHYLPLHMHPLYRERYGYEPNDLPVAQDAYHRIVSLPIYSEMSDEDVEQVIQCVANVVDEARSGA